MKKLSHKSSRTIVSQSMVICSHSKTLSWGFCCLISPHWVLNEEVASGKGHSTEDLPVESLWLPQSAYSKIHLFAELTLAGSVSTIYGLWKYRQIRHRSACTDSHRAGITATHQVELQGTIPRPRGGAQATGRHSFPEVLKEHGCF